MSPSKSDQKSTKILIIGGCGYIGSQLFKFLTSKEYQVDTVDLEWFGNYVNPANIKKNYRQLTKNFLSRFNVIILLAGHSSIAMCKNNQIDSLKNNVENFVYLLEELKDQLFIYASSSSVYGNTGRTATDETYDRYTPINYYDLSKKEVDYYAQLSKVKYYGLRLGTVNGFSPNLRIDLMVNKMYDSAIKNREIRITNVKNFRPILGINDLCRAIDLIITKPAGCGIYNLASFNSTIGEIAKKVARHLGKIKLLNEGSSPGYNFSIDTRKFQKKFNFNFNETVETILESLAFGYSRAKKSTRTLPK